MMHGDDGNGWFNSDILHDNGREEKRAARAHMIHQSRVYTDAAIHRRLADTDYNDADLQHQTTTNRTWRTLVYYQYYHIEYVIYVIYDCDRYHRRMRRVNVILTNARSIVRL